MSAALQEQFRRAVRQYNAGSREAAAASCRRILAADSGHFGAAYMLALILEESGCLGESITLLRRLRDATPGDPRVLYSLGKVLARAAQVDEAATLLARARRLDPDNHSIHMALGYCMAHLGRPEEAAGCYEDALRLKPEDAPTYRAHGAILARLERFEPAIEAYRKASRLDPGDPTAWARLAELYERTNRLDDMASVLAEGLERHPNDPGLRLQKAVCLRRERDLEGALELLQDLARGNLTPDLRHVLEFETAGVLDRLGHYDRAFEHAGRGNRLSAQLVRRAAQGDTPYGDWLDLVHEELSRQWRDAAPGRERAEHEDVVFIFGFPRSGTTLIDALLAVRDDFQVYEEKGFVDELLATLDRHGLSYPQCQSRLGSAVLEELRECYLRAAARYAERRPETVVVDKNPLATPVVPLLYRVFPNAKFVFATRHPLDVLLSCYMYRFHPDSALADCASVEELASAYARVMKTWRLIERHLPLDVMHLRYESLVDDFESESRRLFDFLGVPWDENVLDFGRRTQERGLLMLRNHDRIIQGLYKGSRFRWKRYEKHLRPAVPVLEEAMAYLGYDR